MGHFDETTCNCCVCPMQCILEQLVGEENITIFLLSAVTNQGTIIAVDNFIAFFDDGSIVNKIPIHKICVVQIVGDFDFKLKPIRKNIGECSCVEDPATNIAQSMIGEETPLLAGSFFRDVTIKDVGEGIVIGTEEGEFMSTVAISSCKIENFGGVD
ncbi:hypothetical protein VQL36_05720 [Chengkuizengella sp. SCS-71B]|uniref:hypothetical protein n=1 Tax=Chengkuizengella sp. SCS-71B TaxID=3115290 RepID=UPI0032C24940